MPPTTLPTMHWVHHPRRSPETAAGLARALDLPLAVAHVMVNRGIADEAAARRFLEPTLDQLHESTLMLDLEPAALRIRRAVDQGERIFIQGDYDVDGITSTFLLDSVLRDLGARPEVRIPHRVRDGYGLSIGAIDDAIRRDCTLILTVDCGITAVEAVAYARSKGIDVVITDHHEPQATLPDAHAIVDPLRPGCPYPFKALAGVGVTFKLAERLLKGRGGRERAREYLDVVALGTIADVVPLVGENRVLAQLGLRLLNENRRLGVRALADVAGLGTRLITSGQIAFVLAPRINAAGRMGNAEQGLRLLQAREMSEAQDLAMSLEDDNRRRRESDEKVLREAERMVEHDIGYPECQSIVLWSDEWHPGVIGIVASRLVERYQRPALLVAIDGDRGRGSGRSLPHLDLTRLLDACSDLLIAHGGHAFAAGLTIAREHLPELRERIERLVRERSSAEHFQPRLIIDTEVRADECDLAMVDALERLAPHGLDNSEPMFQLSGVLPREIREVGDGRHLRVRLPGAADRTAIGFGLGPQASEMRAAGPVDLAFSPTRNEWRGTVEVQLKLKSWRPAAGDATGS